MQSLQFLGCSLTGKNRESVAWIFIEQPLFGSKAKSTAGTQAYQIYSEHSSEKGQSISIRILISNILF